MPYGAWSSVDAALDRLRPEIAFLVIGAVAGLCFIVGVPAYQGADEPAHLNRAYQVSEGRITAERSGMSVGGTLPVSMQVRSGPLNPERRVFVDFRNTAPYPPVSYLPHALALALGRTVSLPPRHLLYLGRVAGLMTALGLGFLAIRITPIAKRVFLMLALTPMAIRQMSMVSADSVTNGVSMLLVAVALRLASTPAGPDDRARLIRFGVCSVATTLSKLAYWPLSLLYLVGTPVQRGGRRRFAIGFAVLMFTTAAALAAWLWATSGLFAPQRIAPDADPARQLAHLVADPVRFAAMLLEGLQRDWARNLHGSVFPGQLPRWLSGLYLGVTASVALFDGRRDWTPSLCSRVLIVCVVAATYVSVNAMLYLTVNPVGAATVQFVQPRYFLPIAPLGFLLLSNRRLASMVRERELTLLAAACAAGSSIAGVRWVLAHYHGL